LFSVDAIGAVRNNRYYVHFVLYKSVWVRHKKDTSQEVFLTAERKQSIACGFSARIGGNHSKSLVIKGFFHKAR